MIILTTELLGDTFVMHLGGRLDADSAGSLDTSFDAWKEDAFQALALDLAELEYTSSIGLRSLIRMGKALKAAGREFVLCRPQPTVLEVFRIAGLLTLIPVKDELSGETK